MRDSNVDERWLPFGAHLRDAEFYDVLEVVRAYNRHGVEPFAQKMCDCGGIISCKLKFCNKQKRRAAKIRATVARDARST